MSDFIDALIGARARLDASCAKPDDRKKFEFYHPNQYEYYLREGWLKPGETDGISFGGEIRIMTDWPNPPLTVAEYTAARALPLPASVTGKRREGATDAEMEEALGYKGFYGGPVGGSMKD